MNALPGILYENNPTIRKVASMIGKINAARPAYKHAFLFTKQLGIEKIVALQGTGFGSH